MAARKRKSKEARIPVMVAAYLQPNIEIRQRLAVAAFRDGNAETGHFDVLAECRDVLALGCKSADVERVGEIAGDVLRAIKERFLASGAMTANADEIGILAEMVDVSVDFWNRQSMARYSEASQTVIAGYRRAREER